MANNYRGLFGARNFQQIIDQSVGANPNAPVANLSPEDRASLIAKVSDFQRMLSTAPSTMSQDDVEVQKAQARKEAALAAIQKGIPAVQGAPQAGDPLGAPQQLSDLSMQNANSAIDAARGAGSGIDHRRYLVQPDDQALAGPAQLPGPTPQSSVSAEIPNPMNPQTPAAMSNIVGNFGTRNGRVSAKGVPAGPLAPMGLKDMFFASLLPNTFDRVQANKMANATYQEQQKMYADRFGDNSSPAVSPSAPVSQPPVMNSQGDNISDAFGPQTQNAPPVGSIPKVHTDAWGQFTPDDLASGKSNSFNKWAQNPYTSSLAHQYLEERVKARTSRDKYVKGDNGEMINEMNPADRTKPVMKIPEGAEGIFDGRGNLIGYKMPDGATKFIEQKSYADESGKGKAQAENNIEKVQGTNGVTMTGPRSAFTQGGKAPIIIGQDPSVVNQNQQEIDQHNTTVNAFNRGNDRLQQWSKMMDQGKLTFSPMTNISSAVRNATGNSTENSRNQELFKADVNGLVNDVLNLAKGPQTEGDAKRARDQILGNLNDPKLVKQGIQRLLEIRSQIVQQEQQRLQQLQPPSATTQSAATGPSARAQAIEAAIARKRAQLGH